MATTVFEARMPIAFASITPAVGDREYFSNLVDKYSKAAYALAFSRVSNHADAMDVAQEAFLKAYRALGGIRDTGKFHAWLLAILRNEANQLLRTRKRRNDALQHIGAEQPVPNAPEPGGELESSGRSVALDTLKELKDTYREVIALRFLHSKSRQEIAQTLGLNVLTVDKRLQRGLKMLQEKLRKKNIRLDRP